MVHSSDWGQAIYDGGMVGHSHMDGRTILFSSPGPWSSAMSHLAFYQPHGALESTVGRFYNAHLVQFLQSFSYFLMTPGNLFSLTVTLHGSGR